jgi:hypothetical protein
LPKWDGNKQTLIDAAKAVTPRPKATPPLHGRAFIPDGMGVLPLAQSPYAVPGDQFVPEAGYWLALYGLSSMSKAQLLPARAGVPERFRAGERFEPSTLAWLAPEQTQWHFLGEAGQMPPGRDVFIAHMIDSGLVREIASPSQLQLCNGLQRCPKTGIWEGRVADDHPLGALYNRWEQQAFVQRGEAFSDPRERFLDIAMGDVHWTYLGSPNTQADTPDVENIAL